MQDHQEKPTSSRLQALALVILVATAAGLWFKQSPVRGEMEETAGSALEPSGSRSPSRERIVDHPREGDRSSDPNGLGDLDLGPPLNAEAESGALPYRLRVSVVDANGVPCARARVYWRRHQRDAEVTEFECMPQTAIPTWRPGITNTGIGLADEQGRAEIPCGDDFVELYAQRDDLTSDEVTLVRTDRFSHEPVLLTVAERRFIEISVQKHDGRPAPHVPVTVIPGYLEMHTANPDNGRIMVTDAQGRVRVRCDGDATSDEVYLVPGFPCRSRCILDLNAVERREQPPVLRLPPFGMLALKNVTVIDIAVSEDLGAFISEFAFFLPSPLPHDEGIDLGPVETGLSFRIPAPSPWREFFGEPEPPVFRFEGPKHPGETVVQTAPGSEEPRVRPIITGTLLSEDREPVCEGLIWARTDSDRDGHRVRVQLRPDAKGHFSTQLSGNLASNLRDVEEGELKLDICRSDLSAEATRTINALARVAITFEEGRAQYELGPITLVPEALRAHGRVVDQDGVPVADAEIWWADAGYDPANPEEARVARLETRTDAEGRFEIRRSEDRTGQENEIISVSAPGFATWFSSETPSPARELLVPLRRERRLDIEIVPDPRLADFSAGVVITLDVADRTGVDAAVRYPRPLGRCHFRARGLPREDLKVQVFMNADWSRVWSPVVHETLVSVETPDGLRIDLNGALDLVGLELRAPSGTPLDGTLHPRDAPRGHLDLSPGSTTWIPLDDPRERLNLAAGSTTWIPRAHTAQGCYLFAPGYRRLEFEERIPTGVITMRKAPLRTLKVKLFSESEHEITDVHVFLQSSSAGPAAEASGWLDEEGTLTFRPELPGEWTAWFSLRGEENPVTRSFTSFTIEDLDDDSPLNVSYVR